MAIDISFIATQWQQESAQYQNLGEFVKDYIKQQITRWELFPEVSFRIKELHSIVKKIKKKQRERNYEYDDVGDKLGIRIVCSFQEDLAKVRAFLRENFDIVKEDLKKEQLNYDKLDYTSDHYDAKIKKDHPDFTALSMYSNLKFEVQVRTLNQHAWSNSAHSLSYKQEAELSSQFKRRMYRLLSLYEIADDEFSAINNALIQDEDNLVYSFLRLLESKFYRFARMDYNREIALYQLRAVMSFLSPQEITKAKRDITAFISEHEKKIETIFLENSRRLHEVPWLTQPEIFLVWYALEFFSFSIDDNWADEFDWYELEQIKNLWGKTII